MLALVVVGALMFQSTLEFVHDQLYLSFLGSRDSEPARSASLRRCTRILTTDR